MCPLFPSPFPFHFVFCSCSNFCAITQLETLAMQATLPKMEPSCIVGHVLYIGEWQKRGGLGTTLWPKQSILLPRLCGPKCFQDQPLLSKTSQRVTDIFIFSSQEDLFAKSFFFPLAFSHKNVEQIQWHITITLRKKYSRGKKTLLKRIRCLYYARTHFFVIVIYFYSPPPHTPPPFPPCPARNIVYNNKFFLFSTLILRPALKNNLKNCGEPRSFSKRRDMPLP